MPLCYWERLAIVVFDIKFTYIWSEASLSNIVFVEKILLILFDIEIQYYNSFVVIFNSVTSLHYPIIVW